MHDIENWFSVVEKFLSFVLCLLIIKFISNSQENANVRHLVFMAFYLKRLNFVSVPYIIRLHWFLKSLSVQLFFPMKRKRQTLFQFDKQVFSNKKPFSLLPISSKVFKKLILNKLLTFLRRKICYPSISLVFILVINDIFLTFDYYKSLETSGVFLVISTIMVEIFPNREHIFRINYGAREWRYLKN